MAAELGVSTLPGLGLIPNRHPYVHIDRIPHGRRPISVATYGKPPLPRPTNAFLTALTATMAQPAWPS